MKVIGEKLKFGVNAFKIVYYGPGLGGKTTTLEHLHAATKPEHRGKLVSLATPVDRTLYFDFLPIRLPKVRGMNVRLQLFTVPGQVYFNATRKLVLTGADGIVFVSDSQAARADANLESLENLRENLAEQRRELAKVPLVFQHNKRDLPDLLPVEELDGILNPLGAPSIATSARTGLGVFEALETITQEVLRAFASQLPGTSEGELGASFTAIEGGLVTALRDASPTSDPDDIVVARISDPSQNEGFFMPTDTSYGGTDEEQAAATTLTTAAVAVAAASAAVDLRDAEPARTPTSASATLTMHAIPPPVPSQETSTIVFSFADVWPEAERETVREVEAAIASHRLASAVELCEALVARVFAGAAGLFGSSDAPRDPALIPILLGLSGPRYLAFRATVREARAGTTLTTREALAAFAFAVDARLARSSLR